MASSSSSQLDKAKNRLDSLLKQHSSSSLTDDASVMVRQQKIEDMRKRVELQLAAMVQGGGSEFDKLRQQVAELRTNPQDVEEEDDDEETTVSEFLKLNQIGSATSPTATTTTTTTPATTTTTSLLQTNNNNSNGANGGDEEDSVYVENTLITDPYGDAGEYSGDVLLLATNKPHGVGTMKYQDGRTYSGGWQNGQWHGKGIAIFSNGDQFDGTYDLDRRHGFGTYQWKDGRVYEGKKNNAAPTQHDTRTHTRKQERKDTRQTNTLTRLTLLHCIALSIYLFMYIYR